MIQGVEDEGGNEWSMRHKGRAQSALLSSSVTGTVTNINPHSQGHQQGYSTSPLIQGLALPEAERYAQLLGLILCSNF